MGLCARAQQLEQHGQTEEGVAVLFRTPRRSSRQIQHEGISTPRDRDRHAACRALAVGAVESGRRLEQPVGRGAGKTMSNDGTPAALETGWQLREISYIKGNLWSEIPFYFKSGLSGPS